MIGISLRAKYGPAITRGPGRYHCLAYPCPNITRLFYRPANSHLCPACIRSKYMPRPSPGERLAPFTKETDHGED